MDRERLIELARRAMGGRSDHAERERGYLFRHGLRTARIATALLARIDRPVEAPPETIFAAALFHDVGKGSASHHEAGAAMLPELLVGECEPAELELICRMVREHNQRAQADRCLWASRLVQDADILDHVGAQIVWLGFHWAAAHEEQSAPEQSLAYYRGNEHTQYLHAMRRLLNFPAAREAFDRRLAVQESFYEVFARELNGEP